ncbi:hypothetical protein LCGC14_2152100 [marine sediment metagenome]|uniref:p-aminobenzoate N-oxygenase AurF n=1 Tax=marine sediment metagenome TaxID=412755 RepID=A0A0F9G873_9ZZZZ
MQSMQSQWEKRATVRSRPRIILDGEQTGHLFPLTHQPIAVHPAIIAKGEQAQQYLLTQSLYLYAHDIASIETRFVNKSLLTVTSQALPGHFTDAQQMDAYLIMTDEAYHAYVAFDMMAQVQQFTGITPLPMPANIQILLALQNTLPLLSQKLHATFHLIAVCIGENTLTEEIVALVKKTGCHPSIIKMFKDHLSDEARHSLYFQSLLTHLWQGLDAPSQQQIGTVIPGFIQDYLSMTAASQYFHAVLMEIGFDDQQVTQILADSYEAHTLTATHPIIISIIKLLRQAGVMDSPAGDDFLQRGWLT